MGKIPQHTTSAPFLLSLFLFVFWASSCNFYWEETTHFGQEWTALILVQLKRKKKKMQEFIYYQTRNMHWKSMPSTSTLINISIFTFPGWKSSENLFLSSRSDMTLEHMYSEMTVGDRANTAWPNQDVLHCKNVILRGETAISNSKQPIAALFTMY